VRSNDAEQVDHAGTSPGPSNPRGRQPARNSHVVAAATGGSAGGTNPCGDHAGIGIVKPSKYAAVDMQSKRLG
jgi:hypothetical protein